MTFAQMAAIAFPWQIWVVLGVCALLSAVGFYKFVYFLSVGYGFAICGSGIAIIIMFFPTLDVMEVILCLLFVIYGIRLGGFLLLREIKSASYRKTLDSATGKDKGKPMPVFVMIAIWVCVALLYVMQVSPVLYRAANFEGGIIANNAIIAPIIGAVIMAAALTIESIADMQKSQAKKENPHRFCDRGLYKIVRCPNYFGEILFWTGVLVSGIGSLTGAVQWIIAALGYVLIFYVMVNGAQRLEKRQNKNYGADEEYKTYVNKTPILFPLLPIYHLTKDK